MLLEILKSLLGIILFLSPGILLSFLIFPKTDIIKRSVYSLTLSFCSLLIIGILLLMAGHFSQLTMILSVVFFILVLILSILIKNKKIKTSFNKEIYYLIIFSFVGGLFRWIFFNSIENFGDAYKYAFGHFKGGGVPDLGFYTGMALDHINFLGQWFLDEIFEFIFFLDIFESITAFLLTFLFLGFIYIVFSKYRNRKWAILGVVLMSLGPIEIFHQTISSFVATFSYLTVFALFIAYKSENKQDLLFAGILALTMMFNYYTSAIVSSILCGGMVVSIFLSNLYINKKFKKSFNETFKNKKVIWFLIIAGVIMLYVFVFSQMWDFSSGMARNTQNMETAMETIGIGKIGGERGERTIYDAPSFLGFSAIGWQSLFFLFSGFTFIVYILKDKKYKKLKKEDRDLLFLIIPVAIVSFAFFYVNLPARIFNYFGFFGLLALKIQKKYLKIFIIISFAFLLFTGIHVAEDKKMFFETHNKTIEAAKDISENHRGEIIFSDQEFVNELILQGHYNVTGASDKDEITHFLFYPKNESEFMKGSEKLRGWNVTYIAITQKMKEDYILMVNYPQIPIKNISLFERNMDKTYSNNRVDLYKIKNMSLKK